MNAKKGLKANGKANEEAEAGYSVLKFFLNNYIRHKQSGGKPELNEEQMWSLWHHCLQIADQPDNRLARFFASPAHATIPLIDGLIERTEAGIRSKKLTAEQQRQLETLADELDLALALSFRALAYLVAWRGRHTHNMDLFCEALVLARGDSSAEARLIRRSAVFFKEEMVAGPRNIMDAFAWETYRRVEALDGLVDEFPAQIATAAEEMHGWPMLRQRHQDNRTRFELLAEKLNLGAQYPLDTSKEARFRPDTPMVRFLDPLVYQLHHINRMTQGEIYPSVEEENNVLQGLLWDSNDDFAGEDVLAVLRCIRKLPPLVKATVPEWTKKGLVPYILVTHARDYKNCKEPALKAIASQKGVKSPATFKSRLLATVLPTLRSMARPA